VTLYAGDMAARKVRMFTETGRRQMHLKLTSMTEEFAREIVGWRYPGQYELYNSAPSDVEEDVQALLKPENAYYAVWSDEYGLFGFCCYGPEAQAPGGDYSEAALDVGLGIRPDLAGRGMGLAFLEAILAFAREQYGDVRFRATIAAFNARSRRVFEKAGFRHEQAFVSAARPGLEFVVVVKDPLSETAEDSPGG